GGQPQASSSTPATRVSSSERSRDTCAAASARGWSRGRARGDDVITFLGDVFLTRPVEVEVELPGSVVCNLEAPLTRRTLGYPGKINLRTDPTVFDETFPQAPIAVCLANNHVMDFREEGLADTIEHLERRGIRWFGVGTEADAF